MSAAGDHDLARYRTPLAAQQHDGGSDLSGIDVTGDVLRKYVAEPGQRKWRNAIYLDAERLSGEPHTVHQSDDACLCHAVCHAVDLAVKADLARREHDTAVALGRKDRPRSLGDQKRADQMNVDHIAQVFERRIGEGVAPVVAGIVDHDIERAEGVDRTLHHRHCRLRIGDAAVIRNRVAACRRDLGDDRVSERALARIVATYVDAWIIHHDRSATLGQLQRIGAAKPSPGARHQRDVAVEADRAHAVSSPLRRLQSVTAEMHSATCCGWFE
jgi:hypothetical protein